MAAGAVILSATGRETVEDGLEWIAAGYPLDQSVDEHTLLEALCDVDAPQSAYLETALRRVARQVSASSLDSAAVLFDPELITAPEAFRRALDLVAAKCQDKTLSSITADAVVAAQRKVPETMETLCAVAGLSYSELATRVSELPNDPRGRWSPQQVSAAFKALDDVVNDRVTGGLAGAVPVRAYEALTCSPPGWAAVEGFRANGVPYEVLLGQRSAGGSWLAHRNRTSNRIGRVLVDNVCEALKSRGVPYMRSSAVGGDVAPGELSRRTGCDKQVGLVALDLNEEPAFAIVVSTARDSGTASKNANRLARMTRPSGLPVAVLVAGPGWASRNETAALAQSFGGKLYSDTSIDALADAVASVAKHE